MNKTFLSEKELITGCIRKERDAQGVLYARYSPRLYTLCLRYLGDTEEARDLMHDSIIKAFDSIRSFRKSSESSLYVWLRKITLNLVFDRLKENNRFSGISLEQVSEDDIQIVEEFDIEPSQEIPEFVFKQALSAIPLSDVQFLICIT